MSLISVIIFGVLLGITSGAGVFIEESMVAAVGGSVTFTTSLSPTQTPFMAIAWSFGTKNVITSTGSNCTAPEYEGRITLFISTGSLELRNVALRDTGDYSVIIIPAGGGPELSGHTTLNVYEFIADIFVKLSNPPVEGTSVNLTCDASGSIPTREWMINGAELKPSENIVFYDEKRVLSFRVLNRKDTGKYTCRVSNPVSSQSADYEMNVNYGPDSVQISGPEMVQVGTALKLRCSAESVPTAKFTWTKSGTTLAQSHEFTKHQTVFSDSGEYMCRATNGITMKSSEASRTVHVR